MGIILIILFLISACLATVLYFKQKHRYWANKGIPYIEPSIPFGTNQNPLNPKRATYEVLEDQYNFFKKLGHKHGGIYMGTQAVYTPIHPDLIRNILAKDFAHFQDRGAYYDEKNDPLSAHLLSLEGQKWRNLRVKLTPTFTSGKMKMMFQILLECGEQMMEKLDYLNERNEPIDSKDILACFATDVIGSCAFGVECNSFKDENSQFRVHGRKLFTSNWFRRFRILMIMMSPKLSKRFGVPIFERDLTNFYFDVVKKVASFREETSIKRNDFMQILLELKNNEDKEMGNLTIEEIAAQAFVFFLAGFETSSTLMNYCLFELTKNEEIQEKLREEIVETIKGNDGKISYEVVMEMKYLGQVIEETLRKYPPSPTILRKCVKDYKIPNTDITLEKGTRVLISALGLQYDPDYYPNPEKFDPDRFNEENKAARHPFVYLPFGEGPRICIGLRFGLMQSRVGLALILMNYRVKLNKRTILPLGKSPSSFLLQPINNVYLDIERIK